MQRRMKSQLALNLDGAFVGVTEGHGVGYKLGLSHVSAFLCLLSFQSESSV